MMWTVHSLRPLLDEGTKLEKLLDALPDLGITLDFAGPWLAGGSINRAILGEEIEKQDFDIFFRSRRQHNKTMNTMLAQGSHDVILNREYANPSADPDFVNTYTVTIDDDEYNLQFITIRYFSEITAVLETFPYTVNMGGVLHSTLICHQNYLQDVRMKRLVVNTSPRANDPSQEFTQKYRNRGFA